MSRTNGQSIKNTIGVVMNLLVGMGFKYYSVGSYISDCCYSLLNGRSVAL